MTGKTHRVGGMLCVLGGYQILASRGFLLSDVNPINQLIVMYPFALYGSVVSDMDHNWHSAPCKDIVSLGINKVLHLSSGVRDHMNEKSMASKVLGIFDAQHRSWQTHSELFLIIMVAVMLKLLGGSNGNADYAIIRLVFTGLILGIISHLVLDMFTPEGIWFISLVIVGRLIGKKLPTKISFVPDTKFFRTGGSWETLVRYSLWVLCLVIGISIIYQMSPYQIDFLI